MNIDEKMLEKCDLKRGMLRRILSFASRGAPASADGPAPLRIERPIEPWSAAGVVGALPPSPALEQLAVAVAAAAAADAEAAAAADPTNNEPEDPTAIPA